ncbi:hypothetical protein HPB50_012709 [Hyalomma asiaticum]|uniref:Uncharacterized protein n=1 Tax=Hyalomma asiaticum TaxID=266040 RepID=A0ACB7RTX6_HYAAI|nr:hypothetical protein HPB50_012709 [Hyalomma asiaticum]
MAYCVNCRAKLPEATGAEVQHPFSVETFLDSGEFTDFEFRVKPEDHPDIPERKFRVHKLFLAMRNEVFHAMFFGDLAEKNEVVITDVHPDGFDLLLRKNLKPDRLCSFIDYYMQSREPEMDAIVETILTSSKAPEILVSKEFNFALEETVRYIVDRIRKVSEDRVSKAVFGWAQEQCMKSLQSDNQLEVKTLMRTFFSKLRFLTMTAEEFVLGLSSWGLLEDAENLALLRNIVKHGSQPLPERFCGDIDDRF